MAGAALLSGVSEPIGALLALLLVKPYLDETRLQARACGPLFSPSFSAIRSNEIGSEGTGFGQGMRFCLCGYPSGSPAELMDRPPMTLSTPDSRFGGPCE